ncbi:MAG: GatB/YqeY domain-containing protein [Candidatus Omnitrophica bacterium]|nr:GatB/YqeY domain-containing protein [Candidatus Omnitrophota bacterium]
MMLIEKINADIKQAMKEKDAVRLSTLRLLKAAINNKMIELKIDELKESDIIALIRKDIKRHQDSIEQFKKGMRDDLASKEEIELKILKSYMPKEVSPEKIRGAVKKIIEETGASGKKDFGNVIKKAMEKLKGSADGKTVSSIVGELLSNG